MTFEELKYLYEERAALKEFDGELPKEVAEKQACREVFVKGCPHEGKHK